jgi:hypothetical protein
VYLFRLILASVAEYLHDACALHTDIFKDCEARGEGRGRAICESDAEGYRVFDCLGTTLALV